ncbi:MAG: histidinol-phosphatase [Candidatus Poribacteria bacterium]|nr:histidinol-phosphatase [Candidatus Poribacteria bacterium]
MEINPIFYESHMHTPLCKHATGMPEEYAEVAYRRGLKGIIVTCHNPMKNGWSSNVRMDLNQLDEYVAIVEYARKTWSDKIDVRLGLESDYVPDIEPWLEELHQIAEFHHILGSVHPHLQYYKDLYFNGDILAFQRGYFEHLAMAAETKLFDTLSHPDLVKSVDPLEWNVGRIAEDICNCLDRVAAAGVAMELNTSGLHKSVPEMNPGRFMLEEMHKRNIPVVVGADAHHPFRVADDFEEALDMLSDIGYTKVSIFLNRERYDLDINSVRSSLRPT